MYYVRTTKTASKATAVQVVRYVNRHCKVVRHIGSAHSGEELKQLRQMAEAWIERETKQAGLWSSLCNQSSQVFTVDKTEYLGIRYAFVYDVLYSLIVRFHFSSLNSQLLCDLVIMRLVEPASKLRSIELLDTYFGIQHSRKNLYKTIAAMADLKSSVEKLVTKQAVKDFGFNFSIVFYDVTTLYFESFEPDELRKPGFSKDNKATQPQIVIGLIVTDQGFPVAYEVFEGNTFEGKTLLPVILKFKKEHTVNQLTVVADSAMISLSNVEQLKANHLQYIVGARLANLPVKTIADISRKLNGQDGATFRVETKHGDLICEYSKKRCNKDKSEMEKQVKKAELTVINPGKIKRTKFLKVNDQKCYINQALIEKTTQLLGIKGYYTNLGKTVSDADVINHYRNLWKVELTFRISKSDLQTRPIFHHQPQTIKAHILICFMALALAKYIELLTGSSIQSVTAKLKGITDARMFNILTQKEIIFRSKITPELESILKQLRLSH